MALSTCLYSSCMPRCLIGGQDYLIFSTSFPSGGPGTGGRDVFIKTLFLILDLSYSFLDFRKNEPEKKGPPLLYLSISTTSSLIFVTCCSKSYRPFEFGSRWLNRFTRAHHSSPFTYLPLRKKKKAERWTFFDLSELPTPTQWTCSSVFFCPLSFTVGARVYCV